jgi:hypothetical protein
MALHGWSGMLKKLVSELRETSCSDIARPVGGRGMLQNGIRAMVPTLSLDEPC